MNQVTCEPQTMQWWSDACADCDHLLVAHRQLEEGNECSLCSMQRTLEAAIAAQSKELRIFAEQMRDQAKSFTEQLQDQAKTYIDQENQRFAGVAQQYVDGKVSSLATSSKDYVDKQVPLYIRNTLKPEAFR